LFDSGYEVVIVDNLFNSKASEADRVDKAIAIHVEAGPSRVAISFDQSALGNIRREPPSGRKTKSSQTLYKINIFIGLGL